MTDYNAWSQLFRLNPDTPQTPMLSTQELQDELALWGNAQFQLEAVDEGQRSEAQSRKGSSWNPLFMMGASSTTELLNAITAPTGTQQQSPTWQSQAAQSQAAQSQAVLGGVAMLPLSPLGAQPSAPAKAKVVPIAPAPSAQTAAAAAQAPATASSSAQAARVKTDDDNEGVRKVAADEDKRRRNTAASARFRVKKKLKEQVLERTAREMTAKAEALEKRVQELETETRWLKSLITERDPQALGSAGCPCHHPAGLEEPAAKRAKM
ncbi:hypothetical protein LPJ70_003394 [Coemansia sp. RSA 2708]|nr:hypothetical protein LPJ70_003394 [Coemansia sp. RSA 2708]